MYDLQIEQNAFPVRIEIPVQWGEMDAAGHVNNLVYLRWFESARVDYFTRLGQDVIFNDEGPGFILASQDCKYLFPVTFPDKVLVGVKTTEMGEDRFTMHCKIWSMRHHRLVAIANGVIVTYDYEKKQKTTVPETMKQRIEGLEAI